MLDRATEGGQGGKRRCNRVIISANFHADRFVRFHPGLLRALCRQLRFRRTSGFNGGQVSHENSRNPFTSRSSARAKEKSGGGRTEIDDDWQSYEWLYVNLMF